MSKYEVDYDMTGTAYWTPRSYEIKFHTGYNPPRFHDCDSDEGTSEWQPNPDQRFVDIGGIVVKDVPTWFRVKTPRGLAKQEAAKRENHWW